MIPTVDEARTIGEICSALGELREGGHIARVIVLDESSDDTAKIAAAAGAEVHRQRAVRPDVGPVRGKGDAMWRALHLVEEEITVFVDGDTANFDASVVERLVAGIAGGLDFVKADYDRPWDDGRGAALPHGGGRVTELTAKPLLRALFPALSPFGQPLAGEFAARTELLRSLPFVTGYGVDVALLIDAWRRCGTEKIGEVRVSPRQNRHRPLHELASMADVVASTILARAGLGLAPPERAPLIGGTAETLEMPEATTA
ncbi:MAG: glycosyltransferase [Solirubrobacteraceae bacterium]|nr:glycosyltransferase [Solirubrobacteraceae bacterium]